jgi:hypothetical protein
VAKAQLFVAQRIDGFGPGRPDGRSGIYRFNGKDGLGAIKVRRREKTLWQLIDAWPVGWLQRNGSCPNSAILEGIDP